MNVALELSCYAVENEFDFSMENVWKSSAVFFHFCSLLHSTLLIICVVDCIGCHESISKILFVVTLNENATENKAARCFLNPPTVR